MDDLRYYQGDRIEMLPFIPKNIDTLLEVGCGAGNFGFLLKKRFKIKVCGIEPNSQAAKEAELKIDHVINDFFPSEKVKERFDCIVFNDVIEHFSNPWEAIEKAKLLLNEGGYIIASIPTVRTYQIFFELFFKGDWQYKESGTLDKTHLRFFTKKSIKRFFLHQNLSITKIDFVCPIQTRITRIAKLFFYFGFRELFHQAIGIQVKI